MKTIYIFLTFFLGLSACSMSDTMPAPMVVEDPMEMEMDDNAADQSFFAEGKFMDGAHETTGNVQVKVLASGEKELILTDFMTDPGPDLRIYLSDDLNATNYEEISMTVENGNHTYRVSANFDLQKHPYVLIWCKPAAALFGSAELIFQ